MSTATHEQLRFRPLGRGTFVGGVILALLIHAALGALVWYGQVKAAPRPEAAHDLMVTRTVRFGVVRKKDLLPRIPTQPKPEAPVATVKVTDNEAAAPAKKEPERPKEAEVSKDLKRALDRAKALAQSSSDPVEGDPLGSTSGTAAEASAGDAYATAIMEAVRKNWNVPTGLTIGEVVNLEVEIAISISADGEIQNARMAKKSKNNLYDDSCLDAIKATQRVPPPPPAVRAMYRKGVVLAFGGKDLAQ